VIIHVFRVHRIHWVYVVVEENATTAVREKVTAFVKWGGAVILVTYVPKHFRGYSVIRVREDGPAKHVTDATRGIPDQTVMYVRKVGYRRQML
jgi:hypothetical protein